jgi:anthranilate synthase/aminodeoxychorismate synthase-like glutamine amidotransferase
MSRLLLIDNYDSFTYNLYQYLCELGATGRPEGTSAAPMSASRNEVPVVGGIEVEVRRNDSLTVDDVEALQPDGIILSPGPGRPEDAGICIPVIARFVGQIPILGVCLGHQAIAAAYGARIVSAPELLHGKTSLIHHDGTGLYRGMKPAFQAVRYHSLVADRRTLPDSLIVDAETADGIVMGIRHHEEPLFGVQFHPESILTDGGKILLQNFLDVVSAWTVQPVAVATSTPVGR